MTPTNRSETIKRHAECSDTHTEVKHSSRLKRYTYRNLMPAPNNSSVKPLSSIHKTPTLNTAYQGAKLFHPPLKNKTDSLDTITFYTPTDQDILSGRGGGVNQHPGNIFFRSLAKSLKNSYIYATNKDQKHEIALGIYNHCKNKERLFLQQFHQEGLYNQELWVELDKEAAIKKIEQCLREGAPSFRNKNQSKKPTHRPQSQSRRRRSYVTTSLISPAKDVNAIAAISPKVSNNACTQQRATSQPQVETLIESPLNGLNIINESSIRDPESVFNEGLFELVSKNNSFRLGNLLPEFTTVIGEASPLIKTNPNHNN